MAPARPYLCLSALQRVEEVLAAVSLFKAHTPYHCPHLPCVGFAVDESLFTTGSTAIPRKVPTRSGLEACLSELAGKEIVPALHYDLRRRNRGEQSASTSVGRSVAELSAHFSASVDPFISFVSSAFPPGGLVQLNGVCEATLLRKVRAALPQHRLIYGLKPELYQLAVSERATHIKEAARCIDYLLIDASAGRGIPFSLEHLREVSEALSNLPQVPTIGIAGGLSAKNIASRIDELSTLINPTALAYDVESGIRDQSDAVSLSLVEEFLKVTVRSLSERTGQQGYGPSPK